MRSTTIKQEIISINWRIGEWEYECSKKYCQNEKKRKLELDYLGYRSESTASKRKYFDV